jgi:ankyrin repeat protein
MYKARKPFVVRILETYIGERDRGGCEFAEQMHSVLDVLVEQFDLIGEPKERPEILHTLCCALAMRPSHYEFFTYRKTEPRWWDPLPTAFAVAVWGRYDNVIYSMLETHQIISYDLIKREECRLAAAKSWDFGLPLDMVIYLGRVDQIEMLFDHGARVNNHPRGSTCSALELAAKRGYSDVLELILPPLLSKKRTYQDTLRTTAKVIVSAARHRHWHIVGSMVCQYAAIMAWHDVKEELKNTLWIASTHGQNDIVYDLLDSNLLEPTDWMPCSTALRNAAVGGHLSTCELLLANGPELEWRDSNSRSQGFAQAIARGGRIEMYQFLKQHVLRKSHHEIHFLPIAAERGHLEFAKHTVENGCDRNPNMRHRATIIEDLDRRPEYPDDIRYFALLRAVISGHQNIVQWLVEEVGVDLRARGEIRHPELCPINLAKHVDNVDMMKLLLEYHPDAGLCECSELNIDDPKAAFDILERFRTALHLRKEDYNNTWHQKRPARARRASHLEPVKTCCS